MNFVFVGLNYENTVIFKKLLEMLIDYSGEYYGLYSLEPFKSNKKKINFWYVDEIGTVPKTSSSLDKRDAINNLLEYCNLKNKEYMALINYGYGPSAHEMGIPAGKGIIEDFDEYKSYNRKPLILFAHEMGHHFFEMGEDYFWVSDPNIAPPPNYKAPPNCFVGTKEECESPANTNWYDLIGDGCGSDNIIDCKEEDPNYNAEIGCFEGCNNFAKGIFRSTRATLMYICNEQPGSKALGGISNCAFTYGLFNERRICKRLKALTGSVGGYCTSKFGIS